MERNTKVAEKTLIFYLWLSIDTHVMKYNLYFIYISTYIDISGKETLTPE